MCQASVDRVGNDVERHDFSRSGSREMSGDFPIPQNSDGADLISVEVGSKLRSFQKSPAHQYRIGRAGQADHHGCVRHILNPVNLTLSSNRGEMTIKRPEAGLGVDFDGLSEQLGFASEADI